MSTTGAPDCDAVCFAAQLGRLDLVSVLLAAIGLAVVFGGLFAFLNFRSIAKRQARREARSVAEAVAERVANEYLIRELPDLVREYSKLAVNAVVVEEAASVANTQEDGGHHESVGTVPVNQ